MDPSRFETLTPSQYITFKLPLSSLPSSANPFFYTPHLQISVLDSPSHTPNTPLKLAVMLVPHNRENDWIFTTLAGQLQLLLGSPQIISRLILVGNDPDCVINGEKLGGKLVESGEKMVDNDPDCVINGEKMGGKLVESGEKMVDTGEKMDEKLVGNDLEDVRACLLPSGGNFEMTLLRNEDNVAVGDTNCVENGVKRGKMGKSLVENDTEDVRACLLPSEGDFEIPILRNEDNRVSNDPNCAKNGEKMDKMDKTMVENDHEDVLRWLYPLLVGFIPKGGDLDIPLLRYEDNAVNRVVLELCRGDYVGEMLVLDVEIEGFDREVRRRLIFKRMPNLVQTEVRVSPNGSVDLSVLVHPYLGPMVAGVSLISGVVQAKFQCGVRPKACCIGVGGGALVSFLSKQLGFEVLGVEIDEVVVRVAKEHFGLETNEHIQVHVGDGIEFLRTMSDHKKELYDVIMVDLDSSDPSVGISAPTLEFMHKDVLLDVKSCLFEHGILVLNVISPNREFYDVLIDDLRGVFVGLYEIDCGNEENFAVIASKSSIDHKLDMSENAFLRKLGSVISGGFVDSMRKI